MIHAAAQPSHDLAASRPFDDFDVNATGTLNLLEACRRHTPDAVFITVSTNKVYGDNPNKVPLVELDTRWDYADPAMSEGIDETMPIDGCLHSLFGASKVAADVLTQEYGRYFGMRTGDVPRWLPHRARTTPASSCTGSSATSCSPRLREGAVHDLRVQGEAGPRPDPLGRRGQRLLGLRAGSPARARRTTSVAARPTRPACSSASS